jgi:hypothetical protein
VFGSKQAFKKNGLLSSQLKKLVWIKTGFYYILKKPCFEQNRLIFPLRKRPI